MSLSQKDVIYFARGKVENIRYWSRFGGKPDLKDAVVADLGCGHGSLCIDIAHSGAQKVIGLDLNDRLIDFANANCRINFPSLRRTVEFRCQHVSEMPEYALDYFVSKDTFEHIIGLEYVLGEMKNRLKPGGKIYTGFGPLWNSPFGDHHRTKLYLPWGHVWIPEGYILSRLNRGRPGKLSSIYDLGLNKLALSDYLRIFNSSGMNIIFLKVNVSRRFISRFFSLIRRVPGLTEYLSHNIYCILQKPY